MSSELVRKYPILASINEDDIEEILPPLNGEAIHNLETKLGLKLPNSYKEFLGVCSGFWLFGGSVQLGSQHPFFHEFPSIESLTSQQRKVVKQRGGKWPPPSNGMLCFAEYFLEADGDQVLFKVDDGLVNGEYPVYYYAHEESPAKVSRMAGSFEEWLNTKCIQLMEG